MTEPVVPQEDDGPGLVQGLLLIYTSYLAWRAANGPLSSNWQTVSTVLQLPGLIGDQLAMIAARALARQREGLGSGADELWTAVPQGVQAGVQAGLETVAGALIWTDTHEDLATKDTESGVVPTASDPPEELAFVTAQAVAAASQAAAAATAGWRYKIWQTVGDSHVRESHRALNGQKIPLAASFVTPDGDQMLYPGDPQASIENRIGCRCTLRTAR